MVSAAAGDFVPSLMPDVDPETGLNYTPAILAGDQFFMFKVLATGAVSLTQCLFYKWRKWKRRHNNNDRKSWPWPSIRNRTTTINHSNSNNWMRMKVDKTTHNSIGNFWQITKRCDDEFENNNTNSNKTIQTCNECKWARTRKKRSITKTYNVCGSNFETSRRKLKNKTRSLSKSRRKGGWIRTAKISCGKDRNVETKIGRKRQTQ